jgi:thioredoxin 1
MTKTSKISLVLSLCITIIGTTVNCTPNKSTSTNKVNTVKTSKTESQGISQILTQIKKQIISWFKKIVEWLKNIIESFFANNKTTKQPTESLIQEITDPTILQNKETFENFIKTLNTNVVAKFTADWCPACKLMLPAEKELAEKFKQNIKLIKIDIEKAQALTQSYGISGIPIYIYFKEGTEINRKIGGSHKTTFEREIIKTFNINATK